MSRITPPTRTMPANGPPTWLMPRLASGTPPNGNEKRTASTSVWAAGRPMTRHRPGGATSAATPWNAGEDHARRDVAGDRQLPHPAGAHPEPGEAEEHAVPPPRRPARRRAEGDLEQRDADERQRPPAPRRHRQGDEEAAAERQRERGPDRLRRAMLGRAARGRSCTRRAPGARRCARGPIPAGGRRRASRCEPASGRRSTARRARTISVDDDAVHEPTGQRCA